MTDEILLHLRVSRKESEAFALLAEKHRRSKHGEFQMALRMYLKAFEGELQEVKDAKSKAR